MTSLRSAALSIFGIVLLGLTPSPGIAQEWRTTSSLVGESRYGADFKQYDYVNPQAPKGGTINRVAVGTYDSFNPFIVRGAPAAGLTDFGGPIYDTLMQQSTDESSVSHPLIADAFKYPDDYSSATYRLDPRAKFQDGSPITADDVVWSFTKLKELSPLYTRYFASVTEAVAVSDREVEFRFNQKGNRELPHIMGDLAVLPRHWWEGKDGSGKQRDIAQPTSEPPLGSGAYRIGSFKIPSDVTYERVPDYWAGNLPVNVGRHNFDRQHYVYFQNEDAAWQAFTKGGLADFRRENRAQKWAQEYNFPAVEAGDVVKREFALTSSLPMQGLAFNARLAKFADRRVRQALTYAFDFEGLNRTLFYGLYARTESYFAGGELASSGLPEGKELDILKSVAADLPTEVFSEPFKLPVFDGPRAMRDNLGKAIELLRKAGWVNQGGRLVNEKSGEAFTIEFLAADPSLERVIGPYVQNLRRIGIAATIRVVDASQYVNRVRQFDYDMIQAVMAQSLSPGNEQRDYWSSKAADAPGSQNYAGIKDAAIDKLVDRVIITADRDDLIAATHALDRVLLWNFYYLPEWNNPKIWAGIWNKFGMPEKQPTYSGVDPESWWVEPAKESALSAKYKSAE